MTVDARPSLSDPYLPFAKGSYRPKAEFKLPLTTCYERLKFTRRIGIPPGNPAGLAEAVRMKSGSPQDSLRRVKRLMILHSACWQITAKRQRLEILLGNPRQLQASVRFEAKATVVARIAQYDAAICPFAL
ncbi:hypothetical protein D9M71_458990 [compost metagenome]